jgi:16S rRNA (cytidine1402-2'-O)-methyltransferase
MLFLVSTPIGNLGDITARALATLKNADLVISEDTRKTGFLLKHFEIRKPQLSFREDNEARVLPKILELLRSGQNVALVTDAGTPSVSDPGYILVRSVIAEGLELTAIPGPTALIMAVILSGLPVNSFTFRGFAPHKGGPRRRYLEVDSQSPHTLIFYESPYRLQAFLQDALAVFGDRRAAIANDLTKLFETVQRGQLSELMDWVNANPPRGEYCVVIAGKEDTLAEKPVRRNKYKNPEKRDAADETGLD